MYVVDNVCLFVCVEVLRPSQPNGVMSSMYVVGMKTCCRNSLEAPLQGTTNAYHNLCFHEEIRKTSVLFVQKTVPYL